jgi:hypothetical protein
MLRHRLHQIYSRTKRTGEPSCRAVGLLFWPTSNRGIYFKMRCSCSHPARQCPCVRPLSFLRFSSWRIQSVVREDGPSRLSLAARRASPKPSGSKNKTNAHHRAKMISVPVRVMACLLVHRSNALLHAASWAPRAYSARLSVREMKSRPARSRPGYLPVCRRPA